MKSVSSKGLSFGFSVINAGQRNTVVEPQCIAVSTNGGFRITAPVSKALGVANGEYVMFLTNVDTINNAIADKHPDIVAFCEEHGLDVMSDEAAVAIHKEFDMFAIAKGIKEFDPKGNHRTCTERLSKKDKLTYVVQNFETMLEGALASGKEELVDALTREGITKEEQMDILATYVKPKELPKYKGSKVASPSGTTGTGTALTFTDSNVWNQLKADLGAEASKINRAFDVDVNDIQEMVINDGYKDVKVKMLVLGDYTDSAPQRIGEKDAE